MNEELTICERSGGAGGAVGAGLPLLHRGEDGGGGWRRREDGASPLVGRGHLSGE